MLNQRWSLRAGGRFAVLAGSLALAGMIGPAAAAEGRLRIAKQFGVVYLLLNVIEDRLDL